MTRRTHKCGTLTLGLMLVVFGGLFLANIFWPQVPMGFIFCLWPVALICLGLEVLAAYFFGESSGIVYDVSAIVLVVVLVLVVLFAGGCWTVFASSGCIDLPAGLRQ